MENQQEKHYSKKEHNPLRQKELGVILNAVSNLHDEIAQIIEIYKGSQPDCTYESRPLDRI